MKHILAILLLCSMPLGALAATASPSDGITVSASAESYVQAATARLIFTVETGDKSLTITASALQPIADAIAKAGADPASITLPVNYTSGGASSSTSVSGMFANPTEDSIKSTMASVGDSIAKIRNMHLIGAKVVLENQSCATHLADARAKAVDSARDKASGIAKQLGLTLGKAVTVNAGDQGVKNGSCSSEYWMGPLGLQYEHLRDGVEKPYVTIPLSSYVTITFAIK